MQPQAVSVSDISLYKDTCNNLGLNTHNVHAYVPSDVDTHTSRY